MYIGASVGYKEYEHNPPIVWLDTNVINEITDALLDKPGRDRDIYIGLYKFLRRKVGENKIICPFWGQRTEYSDGKHMEVSDNILLELSSGFQVTRWQLENIHIKRMLRVFLNQEYEFELKDSDLVSEKRKQQDKKYKNSPLSVVILLEKSQKLDRNFLLNNFNRRKEEVSGMTYEQVLKEEYLGRPLALAQSVLAVEDVYGSFKIDFPEGSPFWFQLYPYIAYSELTGKKEVEAGDLKSFFQSPHFYALPIDKISSTLVSHLLTEGKSGKYTDMGDIDNFSAILPYASYIITERRMAHILQSRGLAREFNAKVYRLDEISDCMEEMEKDIT